MGVLRAVKREEAPDFSKASSSSIAIWRRRADSNRRIKVLQTLALSHLATSPQISIYLENIGFTDLCQTGRFVRPNKQTSCRTKIYGAEGGTRTRTSLRTLRPQRSLSTNFSTPAGVSITTSHVPVFSFLAKILWQERRDSNPRPLVLETSALARLSYAPARSKQRAKRERPLITRSTQSYLDECWPDKQRPVIFSLMERQNA